MMNRFTQNNRTAASVLAPRIFDTGVLRIGAIRTSPALIALLLSISAPGCGSDESRADAATPNTPTKPARAVQTIEERRVPTAEAKRKFDARLSRELERSTHSMRRQEKQGVMTIEESKRLYRIGAYLQNKYAVSDEDVDFVLRLIERGPRVNTDINWVRLRMRSISSLLPGRRLTEAQQRRAIKVIGPIANDPPKEKIVYHDGVQSSEISIQLTAIIFLDSTRHPEALALLRKLRKTTRVKEARERIDESLARPGAK